MRRVNILIASLVSFFLTGGLAAQSITFAGTELLGKPTNNSVTINIVPDASIQLYYQYGTISGGPYAVTNTTSATGGQPHEITIDGLGSNTRYYYRMVYSSDGGSSWVTRDEHSFWTQRTPGSTFTFTIVSDSHLGQYGGNTADQKALYQQTLVNVSNDHPDFHLDLGDTFPMDPQPLGTGMTDAEARTAYLAERPYLGLISHSVPVYLVLGNHENEEGWNFDDVFAAPDQSLARIGLKYRKLFYPNPVPDDFYTGNDDPLPDAIGGDTNHEDYYAWTWGDAQFVVLDPFHYSMTWPGEGGTYGGEGQDGEASGDRWGWTLGIKQYLWLKQTLENSDATYKFVFSHHVTGGATTYGRGGIEAAPYFEWGGRNADSTWGFDSHRPASEGWDVPVHQLMVANGVDVYFHGHDHIYSREFLDGIAYVECPKPDDDGYDWQPFGYGYTEGLYPNGNSIQNSGHIRVTVSPGDVKVDYVRAYLPGDGTNGIVADTYTILPDSPGDNPSGDMNGDDAVNSTDALIVLSCDIGIDVSQFCPANCGDVNADGLINSTDALIILSYDVGMTVPFPVGEPGCANSVTPCAGCNP
jgi:hypothetical protein